MLNRTTYLFTEISFAAMIPSVVHTAVPFDIASLRATGVQQTPRSPYPGTQEGGSNGGPRPYDGQPERHCSALHRKRGKRTHSHQRRGRERLRTRKALGFDPVEADPGS